ncbi:MULTISPECIES: hypothetical protein [unclassified Paenibacillus]|uniref:hypothetical protein n=1 Tax=unclassified Paenibacillus TaxID=185978 RepID=UPI002404E298|nr:MULTISPECIES: hypothetical protein [unclassified Paenibacillus]MDF9843742.1 hypothetical protein [Paenibacillus sp. PastF-2]MDF9850419.1 hypothetical protein [Paenibacillus sp. PastM-2]MDF9856878.1 hypothetical protein [Paenibacillus sp. PastF-1]MDH6482265.1 hypothetical protein [Paenibacillus sp. PastH-2]MDH6509571.1 hypothetical protein [Paenibacillus sp. PastM-3]
MLIEGLEVNSVIILDDEVNVKYEEVYTILEQLIYKEDFIETILESETRDIIDSFRDTGELNDFFDDQVLRNNITNAIKRYNPELIRSSISHIINYTEEFFNECSLNLAEEWCNCSDFNVIIMDYDFGGKYSGLEKLEELSLQNDKTYYIIMLSSHSTVQFQDKTYDMLDPEKKQALFRKCANHYNIQLMALLNYINKDDVYDKDVFIKEITRVFRELKSGKIMLDAIKTIKQLLNEGTNEAINQLLLSNTKTMKALFVDKVEVEGVSETTYLVDFSLALAKNIVYRNVEAMEEIHNQLQQVQGWPCEVWDYETDQHMRDLRRIQLLDESVNERYEPIMFGDVFELDIDGKITKAVLLSQVCDLVTRKLKKKDEFPNRNDSIGTLVLQNFISGEGNNYHKMRLGNEEIFWDVRKREIIPTDILDLCSLNDLGKASVPFDIKLERKFSWGRQYYTYIQRLIQPMIKDFTEYSNGRHYLRYKGSTLKMYKNSEKAYFSIRRVGRLDKEVTNHILNLYINIQTRVPLLLDPSKDLIDLKDMEVSFNGQPNDDLKVYYYEKNAYLDLKAFKEGILKVNKESGPLFYKGFREALESEVPPEYYLLNDHFEEKRLLSLSPPVNSVLSKIGVKVKIREMKVNISFQPEQAGGDKVAIGISQS